MHPRISLHQVAFANESVSSFVEYCQTAGISQMTLVSLFLKKPGGMAAAAHALAHGNVKVATVNHPFAMFPNLQDDNGAAGEGLLQAIDLAASLGARAIYLQTGGRGALSWEQAAEKFAALVAPCRSAARARGITLMVENASSFNADIHIAHTLHDTIALAEIAGIGVCIDLQPCWAEAGLARLFKRAAPITGLVQVSDYVLGDRSAPCRAVPGDGTIPLEHLIADILNVGYQGVFDIELVGPRIEAEGARAASSRAAERLSGILTRLGA
jgi:sugar phosphate isomerase/epimerase